MFWIILQAISVGFLAGTVIGIGCLLVGSLFGLWWGVAFALGILIGVFVLAVLMIDRAQRYFWSAADLILWADKQTIEHIDYSAPDDVFRGNGARFVFTYRQHWYDDDAVAFLRELRDKGSALVPGDDDGKPFTVFLSGGS